MPQTATFPPHPMGAVIREASTFEKAAVPCPTTTASATFRITREFVSEEPEQFRLRFEPPARW
jgi:hypothetical protein